MRRSTHFVQFVLAALIVMILGGLVGWYVFVQRAIDSTTANDNARGFNTDPTFGSQTGSFLQNASEAGIAESAPNSAAPRLWRVAANPTAGAGFIASTTRVCFVERSSGNVLTADPATQAIARLTNTLIPQVYEAYFSSGGAVALRSIKDGAVTTLVAPLSAAESNVQALLGVQLPIDVLSLSPARDDIVFLVQNGAGAALMRSNWSGQSARLILSLPLSSWIVMRSHDGSVFIAQRPSDGAAGYAYRVTDAGGLVPLVQNVAGLTISPRSANGPVLYGSSEGGLLSLSLLPTPLAEPIHLTLRTSADKCVWARSTRAIAYCAVPRVPSTGPALDERSQGILHTADAWWRIDGVTGETELIFSPPSDVAIDVERPLIDEKSGTIVFMNRTDKSLWMLRITE